MNRTDPRTSAGFTLIEVLAAVTIFGIAMTTLLMTFNAVVTQVDPVTEKIDLRHATKTAMDRIRADLNALHLVTGPAYHPPDMDAVDPRSDPFRLVSDTAFVQGERFSRLRFASFEHLDLSGVYPGRIGVIRYYVTAEDTGHRVLRRADTGLMFHDEKESALTDTDARDPVLCDRVLEFETRFTDSTGETRDTWDSDSPESGFAPPRGVMIRLTAGDDRQSESLETFVFLPVYREPMEDE